MRAFYGGRRIITACTGLLVFRGMLRTIRLGLVGLGDGNGNNDRVEVKVDGISAIDDNVGDIADSSSQTSPPAVSLEEVEVHNDESNEQMKTQQNEHKDEIESRSVSAVSIESMHTTDRKRTDVGISAGNSTNSSDHNRDDKDGDIITAEHPVNADGNSKNSTSSLPRPHPHAGARYPDGRYGYIADVKFIRKQHFSMLNDWNKRKYEPEKNNDTFVSYRIRMNSGEEVYEYTCNTPIGKGYEGVNGLKVMQKVQVGGPSPQPELTTVNISNGTYTDANQRRLAEESNEAVEEGQFIDNSTIATANTNTTSVAPRILCAVYTHSAKHETNLQAAVDTWAWKCDGFFAASTVTNETLGAVDLPHQGEEKYQNMWQKTRSIWAYIHDNYVDDFDYFLLGGDDLLLIVENLRNFLAEATESNPAGANDNNIPVYLGSQHPMHEDQYYCSGAPGYILNRVAVKRLIAEVLQTCWSDKEVSSEDRFLAYCLKSIGIRCGDTADAKGQQRFHGMDPEFMAKRSIGLEHHKRLYDYWGSKHGYKVGLDVISEQLTGYHNLRYPAFIHRLHALSYPGVCSSNTVVGQTLNEYIL